MTESTTETENNVKKRWSSEPNIAIFTLLLTILGIMLGGFYHISSGIAANGIRIDENNKRIDATNDRIDATNDRIDENNERIDDAIKLIIEVNASLGRKIDQINERIDDLQYLFASLNVKVGELENNDENQDTLINRNSEKFDRQSLETRELNDRLSNLELAQAGEN